MTNQPNWTAFESWLAAIQQREQIPGVSVGVSQGGKVVYAKGFGVADIDTGRPVDDETVYGIASVSKSFAALAVMQVADEGKVDPYGPVVAYLPEFNLRAAPDKTAIKVHHCLSHTTGCPPLKREQGKFAGFEDHLRYLAEYDTTLLGQPGEYMSYCNDLFMLSGAIVERVTGQAFSQHVTERVFRPLGMTRSTYDLDELAGWDNVTEVYNLNQDKTAREKQPWPKLGTYYVGGGIRSTVRDLLRYGDMYCAGGQSPDGTQVVSEVGVMRLRAPVYPVGGNGFYCYGMQITPAYHGVTLVEHGGSLPGVASRWGYVPELGMSAVVLSNLRGAPADQIYTALINTALGVPVDQLRRPPAPTFPLSTAQLERLAGTYKTDEGANIKIELEGDELFAEMDKERRSLRPTAPDAAAYMQQGRERPIRWYLREDGPAWGMRFGVRIARRSEE